MTFEMYRLPDGTVVPIDATVSKGAPSVTFELRAVPPALRGQIVIANRLRS